VYTIYDVSVYDGIAMVTTGTRPKEWLNIDGVQWLFKEARGTSVEYIVEKIAYELCKPLYFVLPHAETELASRQGKLGSISKYTLTGYTNCVMYEFKSMIKGRNYWSSDSTKAKSIYQKYGVQYSVETIATTISEELLPYFIRAMLFDFLIGNSDRHHSNWGIIWDSQTNASCFCPLYDSGSGLLSTKPESTVERVLKSGDFLNHVSSKSSMVRVGSQSNSNFSTLLSLLRREYTEVFVSFTQLICSQWTDQFLYSCVYQLGDLATENRKVLMFNLLRASRDKLAGML